MYHYELKFSSLLLCWSRVYVHTNSPSVPCYVVEVLKNTRRKKEGYINVTLGVMNQPDYCSVYILGDCVGNYEYTKLVQGTN